MRAPAIILTAVVSTTLFISGTAAAMDEHSIEGVRSALQSPIPDSALQQARQLDDQMLRSGIAMGTKVYLVTDERQQRVQNLVSRVLAGIGESPQGWVVRVFDTEPKDRQCLCQRRQIRLRLHRSAGAGQERRRVGRRRRP